MADCRITSSENAAKGPLVKGLRNGDGITANITRHSSSALEQWHRYPFRIVQLSWNAVFYACCLYIGRCATFRFSFFKRSDRTFTSPITGFVLLVYCQIPNGALADYAEQASRSNDHNQPLQSPLIDYPVQPNTKMQVAEINHHPELANTHYDGDSYDSWQQQIDYELLTEWQRLSGLSANSHQLRWPVSQFQPTQHCQQAVSWQTHQTIQPGRLQLQIRCDKPFWQLNTSLILDQERLVAVAQRDIARGQRLESGNIRFVPMNVAELPRGYISDDCQCDTWQAKRTIKQGSVLTPALLEPMTLIERGQAIMIHSQQPGMTIAMAGIALSDGHLQQRIRVRNTSSDRIIWARVVAADRVQVP